MVVETEAVTAEAVKAVGVRVAETAEVTVAAVTAVEAMAAAMAVAAREAVATVVGREAAATAAVVRAAETAAAAMAVAMAGCQMPRQHSNARQAARTPRDSHRCECFRPAPPHAARQHGRERTPPMSTQADRPDHSP